MLPPIDAVLDYARESLLDGSLVRNVLASLARLAAGFAIGMALAVPLGLAIALNRHVPISSARCCRSCRRSPASRGCRSPSSGSASATGR
jgi:hypothetical protein